MLVGINAFDLKEDEIDITPWLPILCDGSAHNLTILVSGLNDDGDGSAVLSEATGDYWLITGKIFIWLDADGHITTGTSKNTVDTAPELNVSSTVKRSANGTTESLSYIVIAKRDLSFHSTINLSYGEATSGWQQTLSFTNEGSLSDGANVQSNLQRTRGLDISSNGYTKNLDYSLRVDSVTSLLQENISILADVDIGQKVSIIGTPVHPTGLESFSSCTAMQEDYRSFQGAWLSTYQSGVAYFSANESARKSFSYGTTEQYVLFSGIRIDPAVQLQEISSITGSEELFSRHAKAVNGSVIEDKETLFGTPIGHFYGHAVPEDATGLVLSGVPGHRMLER